LQTFFLFGSLIWWPPLPWAKILPFLGGLPPLCAPLKICVEGYFFCPFFFSSFHAGFWGNLLLPRLLGTSINLLFIYSPFLCGNKRSFSFQTPFLWPLFFGSPPAEIFFSLEEKNFFFERPIGALFILVRVIPTIG